MSDVFHSIFAEVEAFIYRCKNDSDYTMEYMEGSVKALSGYTVDDLLENRRASWVGITCPDDVDQAFTKIDKAIEARKPWDVVYRIIHKSGHPVWIRERGNAVFDNGELLHLQGLIVSAEEEMSLRQELESSASETAKANTEIVEVASLITDSIKQLSLLSINARVEAARSGEAGAAFGVVADEIKSLADQNSRWAAVITEKLTAARPARTKPSAAAKGAGTGRPAFAEMSQ